MNFSGEEDQTCYDINRLRKPDSTFDRGYYYSSLSTKYQKGCLKQKTFIMQFACNEQISYLT